MSRMASQIQEHRGPLATTDIRHVTLAVPVNDAPMLRRIAAVLRAGGQQAEQLRAQMAPGAAVVPAQDGEALLAFFRASPLVGEDLRIERHRAPGRHLGPAE